jgi:hypothetical protein
VGDGPRGQDWVSRRDTVEAWSRRHEVVLPPQSVSPARTMPVFEQKGADSGHSIRYLAIAQTLFVVIVLTLGRSNESACDAARIFPYG